MAKAPARRSTQRLSKDEVAAVFAAFARANPELFAKDLLRRWYRPEQLATPLARRTFVLPDPAP